VTEVLFKFLTHSRPPLLTNSLLLSPPPPPPLPPPTVVLVSHAASRGVCRVCIFYVIGSNPLY
jgi:hypothetical protein